MAKLTDLININDPNFLREYEGKYIQAPEGYYKVSGGQVTPWDNLKTADNPGGVYYNDIANKVIGFDPNSSGLAPAGSGGSYTTREGFRYFKQAPVEQLATNFGMGSGSSFRPRGANEDMNSYLQAKQAAGVGNINNGGAILPAGQASPEQITRYNAGIGEYAQKEPTFNIASVPQVAQAGATINSGDPNLYIGATNWAKLLTQYTPQQLNAATETINGKKYWKVNAPISGTTITPESLKSGKAINVPGITGTPTGNGATVKGTSAVKAIDEKIAEFTQTDTAEQKQFKDVSSLLQDLIPQTAGQTQALSDEYAKEGGVNEIKKQYTNAKNTLNSLIAEREALKTEQHGRAVTMNSIIGAQAQINAVYDSKILTQTALVNGLLGNLTQAKEDAQSAVDVKFAPILEAINIAQAQLNALIPTLNAQEKIRAEAVAKMYDEQQQAVADQKAEEVNIKNVMFKAMDAGITNSEVLSQISNAKTLDEAMNILAKNTSQAGGIDATTEYKNWTLAGGQAGTGMSFAEWQGKVIPGEQSSYQTETATKAIQSIDELIPQINANTTGWGAFFTGKLPQSQARNFSAQLDTLKSNIAFGALTAMREASKTGGALGQVSDREIKLLESTLGALDQLQSGAQLKTQLEKIKASIQRWNSAAGASTNTNMSDFNW